MNIHNLSYADTCEKCRYHCKRKYFIRTQNVFYLYFTMLIFKIIFKNYIKIFHKCPYDRL